MKKNLFTSFSIFLMLFATSAAFGYDYSSEQNSTPRYGIIGSVNDIDAGNNDFNGVGLRLQGHGFLVQGQVGNFNFQSDEYDWIDVSANIEAPIRIPRTRVTFAPHAGLGYTKYDKATGNTASESAIGVNAGVELRARLVPDKKSPAIFIGASQRLFSSNSVELSGKTPNSHNNYYTGVAVPF